MSSQFTQRQLKALLLAYPLYTGASAVGEERADTNSGETAALIEDFLNTGVPKVEVAFANELQGDVWTAIEGSFTRQRKRRRATQPHWQSRVPYKINELLMAMLGPADDADTALAPSKLTSAPCLVAQRLTPSERQLIGLWHQERKRKMAYRDAYTELMEYTRAVGKKLLSATEVLPNGAAPPTPHVPGSAMRPSTQETIDIDVLQAPGHQSPSVSDAEVPCQQQRTEGAYTTVIPYVCAGCGEEGGDLFRCSSCHSMRHEACAGPHPPENGASHSSSLCKSCRCELQLSDTDSSNQLRSTTSSSERARLDQYFSTSDDDSSLSGFIVHTSEDDDETVDDEGNSNIQPCHPKPKKSEAIHGAGAAIGGDRRRRTQSESAPARKRCRRDGQKQSRYKKRGRL